MSDETEPTQPSSPEITPRARKSAAPKPKKAVKVQALPVVPESTTVELPETEWPEPEAATAGITTLSENTKRKRRRRKGKGKGDSSQVSAATPSEAPAEGEAGSVTSDTSQDSRPAAVAMQKPQPAQPPNQAPRPKIDPGLLTKMAWKIFLAEVSEEGVALIADNDAKDLSRRCFRLAEIFVEEQMRRR